MTIKQAYLGHLKPETIFKFFQQQWFEVLISAASSEGYTSLCSIINKILDLGELTCPRVMKAVSVMTQHSLPLA